MIAGGVIVAAGRGERFGQTSKILAPIAGRPMLAWSLDAFGQCPAVRDLVVVVGPHTENDVRDLIAGGHWPTVTGIVEGGLSRAASVANGIAALSDDVDVVVIHDAARPLVNHHDIQRAAIAAFKHGAAILATPVTDTLKRVSAERVIEETIDRSSIWAAQTPQAFRRLELLTALGEVTNSGWTDEAMVFERLGFDVKILAGSRDNLKVTLPEDLDIVDFLMRRNLGML
ncbi:MAG: 2-C-methyl-D-erythritol 4-phosphate cytidylyltransferase [Thermomicrobiales bacterium]